jgi:hypothetical protein
MRRKTSIPSGRVAVFVLKPVYWNNSMSARALYQKTVPQVAETETSEWRFVIGIVVLALTITSLPYLYAYLTTPTDKHFMGIMLDVPDHAQYFSWMRELSYSPLAANKLTPEFNKPVFFNLLWWSLGRLGRLLGFNYAIMFQILRFVAGTLFLLLAYRVCAWFLADRLMRRTAFLIIAFTSGFGWALIGLKYLWGLSDPPFPLLVYIAEGNTFLDILGYPHFVSAALYIFVFDLMLRGQAKEQLRYAVAAGLVALFFGWQHAYDLVLVYGVLGSFIVTLTLRDRRLPYHLIKASLVMGIISWWPALYSVLLTSLDPVWKEVLAQFANAGVYTPNPLQLLILLGPAFLLAIFVVIKDGPFRLKGLNDNDLFLKTWFLANFVLIYIPTDYQIHMLNGWQIPIAILATKGLFGYVVPVVERITWFKTRDLKLETRNPSLIQHSLVAIMILAIVPTNVYLWAWRFVDLSRHDHPYYLYNDELAALTWLETNARSDTVTLSSLTIGQYIPVLTGAHAFLGHWAQTLDFNGKSAMVEEFFDESTHDARRQQILEQYSVDYVFYGPMEQALGTYNPDHSPFLTPVFSAPLVKVYAIGKPIQ